MNDQKMRETMDAGPELDELARRREEAQQRILAASRLREERRAAKEEVAEVEALERQAEEEEAFSAACADHGEDRVTMVKTSVGSVIVRGPDPIRYKRFRDKGSSKTEDLERLVRPCVVYPKGAKLDAIFDVEPATLDRLANAVVILAGHRDAEVREK